MPIATVLEQGRCVVGRKLVVESAPPNAAEDKVTQEDGVIRARNADVMTPRPSAWNPFQELEAGERGPRRTHPSLQEIDREAIPDGMEGHYFH